MTKLEDWYADTENLSKLRSLLSDPILQKAIEVVLDQESPRRNMTVMDSPNASAAVFNYQAGIYDAFRKMNALTLPPQNRRAPRPITLENENPNNP